MKYCFTITKSEEKKTRKTIKNAIRPRKLCDLNSIIRR